MTKKTLLIAVLALLTTPVFAQELETEYELRPNEKRGWIIVSTPPSTSFKIRCYFSSKF